MSQRLLLQLESIGGVIAAWEIGKAVLMVLLGRRTRNPIVRRLKRYLTAAKAIRRAL